MSVDGRIDSEVAGYRIVELLGRGGMSVVYRAEHVRLGRPAALKLLAATLGQGDHRERFLRESKLAASLDHPGIVPVFDAGEEDGLLYIAMAYVEGSDLKTLLVREGKLPLRRALRILGQVASALDAAHARGLVHRDVKPANILVGPGDRAYLSDFGVVKELAAAGTTRTGSFVGTIEYSAPEQIEGKDVDARADVYALAVVVDRLAFDGGKAAPQPATTTVLVTPPAGPPPLDRLLLKSKDGRTLNDAAFALINAGEYDRALPFARKAMRDAKIGTLTRGYATFNVGYALLNLGRDRKSVG